MYAMNESFTCIVIFYPSCKNKYFESQCQPNRKGLGAFGVPYDLTIQEPGYLVIMVSQGSSNQLQNSHVLNFDVEVRGGKKGLMANSFVFRTASGQF